MTDILCFDSPFDPVVFDNTVSSALNKASPTSKEANEQLNKFKNDERAHTRIEPILSTCKLSESHLIALQIFERLIKTRLYTFGDEQRANFRAFLFKLIIEKSRTGDVALPRYNQVFVNLMKREWPLKHSSMVAELISTAQTINIACCTNTFRILSLLIEEVYCERNAEVRRRRYIGQLGRDAPVITAFVAMVLEKGQAMDASLVEHALAMLAVFARHVEHMLDDTLVRLVTSYLNSAHTLAAVKTLYEINRRHACQAISDAFFHFLVLYFGKFRAAGSTADIFAHADDERCVNKAMTANFVSEYARMAAAEREFLFQSAYLITTMTGDTFTPFAVALAELPDLRIFKILLDRLPLTNRVFAIIVRRMPRPIEVLIVENENGEIVREKVEGTETLEFARQMSHRAWQFAHMCPAYARAHLARILEGLYACTGPMDTALLNGMCWTVGSIQGALPTDEEDPFYVETLKDLLTFCENRHRKEDKAIIASNIMYIVGKYYLFLRSNRNFLRTVVKKLFEFMQEEYEGIKDMACDTLLMICEKVALADMGSEFTHHIISNMHGITAQLQPYQQRVVYASLLHVIRGRADMLGELCRVLRQTGSDPRTTGHYVRSQALVVPYHTSADEARHILGLYGSGDVHVRHDVHEYFTAYFRHAPLDSSTYEMVRFFVCLGPADHRNMDMLSAVSARLNGRASGGSTDSDDEQIDTDDHRNGNRNRNGHMANRDDSISNDNMGSVDGTANEYFNALVSTVILPALTATHTHPFILSLYTLIDCSLNATVLNRLLMHDTFMDVVHAGMHAMPAIARMCMRVLTRLYALADACALSAFVDRHAVHTAVRVVDMLAGRDRECVLRAGVLLLQRIMRAGDRTVADRVRARLLTLPNFTEAYAALVVNGMVTITSVHALLAHARDFQVRAHEYFDTDDYADEVALLEERTVMTHRHDE